MSELHESVGYNNLKSQYVGSTKNVSFYDYMDPKGLFNAIKKKPIALAQVMASNNSESLLNEIRQVVHYLHQSKGITKKVYNGIIKSIQ